MTKPVFVLRSWHVYVVLILGVIVRLIYGLYAKNWQTSPDQIAWQLSLTDAINNNSISYRSLIHYPHEGGSFFISLIAICLQPFDSIMPPLSLAAMLIDTLGRFLQIKFTQRMFGSVTAGWFALWTVLSVPLLIPWATLNFGLHALTSFLPFIFLYYLTAERSKYSRALICGVITGLSISLSYNSLIFIPAFLIYTFFIPALPKQKLLIAGQFILITILTLIPHFLTRYYFDTGFILLDLPVFSVRGVPPENIFTFEHVNNFFHAWHRALPSSFLISSAEFISSYLQRDIIFIFFMIAGILLIIKHKENNKIIYPILMVIFLYMLLYAFSPFYSDEINIKSFIYYRHLTYIVPLVGATLIYAFLRFQKISTYLMIAWLLVCGSGIFMFFKTTKQPEQFAYRAAGWVLAQKYGDDTKKLMSIYELTPDNQKREIMTGYGWGLTSVLLNDKTSGDNSSLNHLILLLDQFPPDQKEYLRAGIHYAFETGITPVLEQKLLPELENKW